MKEAESFSLFHTLQGKPWSAFMAVAPGELAERQPLLDITSTPILVTIAE